MTIDHAPESVVPTESLLGSESRGITRRQVTTAAAWAVPVFAVAVAAPMAAASPTGEPCAIIVGELCEKEKAGTRTVAFTNGVVAYDDDGTGISTGELTLRFTSTSDVPYAVAYDVQAFSAAGWTLLPGGTPTDVSFTHASLSGNEPAFIPEVGWAGTGPVTIDISVSAANTDVTVRGITRSFG
jgi:hypothetical protein